MSAAQELYGKSCTLRQSHLLAIVELLSLAERRGKGRRFLVELYGFELLSELFGEIVRLIGMHVLAKTRQHVGFSTFL